MEEKLLSMSNQEKSGRQTWQYWLMLRILEQPGDPSPNEV